tara:strand:+ start:887 stop:1414 length:528 start_codon:yes stop_codon:yes gene_type:complete
MLDLNLEEIIIIIIRILGSIPVIFFPFLGSILAIITDLSDLFLMNFLDLGGVNNYQQLDKTLDLFYMFTFLIVSLRWSGYFKTISIFLFIFRIVGVILFFTFDNRIYLLYFPNFFEFWILFIVVYKKIFSSKISNFAFIFILITSIFTKIAHEIFIHGIRTLDNYTLSEFFKLFY